MESFAPVSTPVKTDSRARITAPDWSSTVPVTVPRLVWACAASENTRAVAILERSHGRAPDHRSLLRPMRPGLVDQQWQVVYPTSLLTPPG